MGKGVGVPPFRHFDTACSAVALKYSSQVPVTTNRLTFTIFVNIRGVNFSKVYKVQVYKIFVDIIIIFV